MSYIISDLGLGYATFDVEPAPGPLNAEWGLLRDIVAEARIGRFDLMRKLRTTIEATDNIKFHYTACAILGDGGFIQDLEKLIHDVATVGFEYTIDIVQALAFRGRLADIPIIFSFYERNKDNREAQSAQLWLDWLLRKPGEEEFPVPDYDTPWEEYRKVIAQRYFSIWAELGTNMVYIHRGGIFDLGGLAEFMLSEAKRGSLSIYDRRLFEANTGWCCSKWFNEKMSPMYLQVAADLEDFLERDFALPKPGQRFFMGHPLPDVTEDPGLLTRFPASSNNEGRGVFDHDDGYFEMESGLEGYFCHSPLVPPTAQIPAGDDWPWLTFQICLREAKLGNRDVLTRLASLVKPVAEHDMFPLAAITVLADAADDIVIAPWRKLIQESSDSDFIFELCCGLLRRGMLRDVPLVLAAYQRIQDNPDSKYLQQLFNELFPFAPILENKHIEVSSFCEMITARADALAVKLGGTNFRIFRGSMASTQAVAREVIDLQFGSRVTWDLKDRFERTTGIDCSDWEVIGGTFDATIAAKTAQRFLDSGGGEQETPGELYFFGYPVKVR